MRRVKVAEMNNPFVILCCLLMIPALAIAQLSQAAPEVQQACRSAVATPLPHDIASAPLPAKYPACDSYALYDKGNFPASRACAIQERAALLVKLPGSPTGSSPPMSGWNDEPAPAGGLAVLTELYANGEGVSRNPALAVRFLCEGVETGEVEHGDDETANILATRDRLGRRTPDSPRFAFCVSAQAPEKTPSTRNCEQQGEQAHAEMHASGIQSGIDDAQQDADDADKALQPVLQHMTPVQRAAFAKAQAAERHFIDVMVTGNTLFMGGYGSGGLYPNEERAAFENAVVAAAQKPPPTPAASAVTEADQALNSVYQRMMAALPEADPQRTRGITSDGLRTEQRAWLAYRDAMVEFGRVLHPQTQGGAWLLALTQARIDDLKSICDLYCGGWVKHVQQQQTRADQANAQANAEVARRRAQVAQFFDLQTPTQAAAWTQVQAALSAFVAAHNASIPLSQSTYAQQQLENLYAELYAFQYNRQHGFAVGAAKAEDGYRQNDARLNAAYQEALGSACPFQPLPQDPPGPRRTPDALREEQRAWLKRRDAWVVFLATLFPDLPRPALANMLTGSRALELHMLTERCRILDRARQQPPPG